MKKTIYSCDRCSREIDGEKDVFGVILRQSLNQKTAKGVEDRQGDLCSNCSAQLNDWLSREDEAPVGYKWVPRPCPHHVPCADPSGCSGQELVPA